METEWEATFWPIEKEEVRKLLRSAGATLTYSERLMRRRVFKLPMGSALTSGWVRVRDEGDRVTMSIKQSGTSLEDQREMEITVSDFDTAVELVRALGCVEKAYQETKRELWELSEVQITLDEWPFLPPFVEIEGKSEEKIKNVADQLGFPWNDAIFGSVDVLYNKQYGTPFEKINTGTPHLVFEGPNPFQN